MGLKPTGLTVEVLYPLEVPIKDFPGGDGARKMFIKTRAIKK